MENPTSESETLANTPQAPNNKDGKWSQFVDHLIFYTLELPFTCLLTAVTVTLFFLSSLQGPLRKDLKIFTLCLCSS